MKLLCALLLSSSALFAQIIEGTVADSTNGVPVPGVRIEVRTAGRTAYQSVTDAQGAFRIEGVRDGEYTATFDKPGYAPPPRGSKVLRPFRVSTGSDPVRLQAVITPFGMVTGRVLGSDRKAVPGAETMLSRRDGWARSAMTDAQGCFSIQVPPGQYALSITPPAGLKPPAPEGGQRLNWVRTYYPGAKYRDDAAVISVPAASELPGYDVRLLAAPVHSLRGVIFDINGDPARGIAVTLSLVARSVLDYETSNMQTVSAADGPSSFAICATAFGASRRKAKWTAAN